MQRSTLNCNVPLTGYSRTYRYALIYVYIYIYISTLAEQSLEIYISSSVKGRPPSMAWARTHAQPHKTHTSSRVRRCRSHYVSSSRFWGRRVLQESLWSSKLGGSWQSAMETQEGRLMTHESAFTHELDFFCVWVRLFFCCFFFLASLAHSACWKSLMNQLLSHRVE